MTATPAAAPAGTLVLAAWDASHFLDLTRPGALDSPYVLNRLARWTITEVSDLTGYYYLTREGTDGPQFSATSREFVPAEGAPVRVDVWTASAVQPKAGWRMAGVGEVETITTQADGRVTFGGDAGFRTFPGLDTLVEATAPAEPAAPEPAATYDHPSLGLLLAVPTPEGAPAQADWAVVREATGRTVGYVTDSRADAGGTASAVMPEDDDAKPYESFTEGGRYITVTHSLRGALAAAGNNAGRQLA